LTAGGEQTLDGEYGECCCCCCEGGMVYVSESLLALRDSTLAADEFESLDSQTRRDLVEMLAAQNAALAPGGAWVYQVHAIAAEPLPDGLDESRFRSDLAALTSRPFYESLPIEVYVKLNLGTPAAEAPLAEYPRLGVEGRNLVLLGPEHFYATDAGGRRYHEFATHVVAPGGALVRREIVRRWFEADGAGREVRIVESPGVAPVVRSRLVRAGALALTPEARLTPWRFGLAAGFGARGERAAADEIWRSAELRRALGDDLPSTSTTWALRVRPQVSLGDTRADGALADWLVVRREPTDAGELVRPRLAMWEADDRDGADRPAPDSAAGELTSLFYESWLETGDPHLLVPELVVELVGPADAPEPTPGDEDPAAPPRNELRYLVTYFGPAAELFDRATPDDLLAPATETNLTRATGSVGCEGGYGCCCCCECDPQATPVPTATPAATATPTLTPMQRIRWEPGTPIQGGDIQANPNVNVKPGDTVQLSVVENPIGGPPLADMDTRIVEIRHYPFTGPWIEQSRDENVPDTFLAYEWKIDGESAIGSTINSLTGEFFVGNNGAPLLTDPSKGTDKILVLFNDEAIMGPDDAGTRNDPEMGLFTEATTRFPLYYILVGQTLITPQEMTLTGPSNTPEYTILVKVGDQFQTPLAEVGVTEDPTFICTATTGHQTLFHMDGSQSLGDATSDASGGFTDTYGVPISGGTVDKGYVVKNTYEYTYGTFSTSALPNTWYQVKILRGWELPEPHGPGPGNWAIVRLPESTIAAERLCNFPN
jgi:hypothetical protein